MTDDNTQSDIPSPVERLRTLYSELGTFAAVARELGVSAATVHRVYNGHVPKDRKIRRALGFTDSRAAVTVRDNDTGLVIRFRAKAAELGMSNQELGLEAIRTFLNVIDILESFDE